MAYLTIHAAADETAMLALVAVRGDACVRADTSAVYQLTGTDPASASDWQRLLGMEAIVAAAAALRQLAVDQASIEVDEAMRYQGSRYEADQVREFPRWADERIVDEDAAGEPVVPSGVLLAVLCQANSILLADRDERADARHDGVSSQGADGLQEAYGGEERVLCRRAHQLMGRYRLRSGSLQ